MAKSIPELIEEINAMVAGHQEEDIKRSAAPFLADTSGNPLSFNSHPEKDQDSSPERRGLLPIRHSERDFFLCDLFDYALKDDHASMEAPMFTLSTKPDLNMLYWESKDGSRSVTVTPSILGRATQHDKDILIYLVSQLTGGMNRNRDDTRHRTVRFTAYDYLVTTNKSLGGKEYQRIEAALERLRGTNIKTNIRTAGVHIKKGFGLIDQWEIIEKSPTNEHMIAVEATLSEWLFNAVQAHEVLTIHPDYFRLRKPLARRLYELARKHCGHQASWRINLDLLHEKTGSQSTPKEFSRMVKAIEAENSLPNYSFVVNFDNKVTFYLRA